MIEDKFTTVDRFSEGIAKVTIDKKMAYIDKSGKYIWGPQE